ncbi:MAG: RES family NAD+ phosphorylase [Bryobacteraceae bacterium]|nr:RES family NAD+ phosphorylase [Bryobacteraceae bacterium]
MTQVYRILRKPYARYPFDGEGAYRFGGRWSSPGTRVAYASSHMSLAMVEYFVHLDSNDSPRDLVIVAAQVPDNLPRVTVASGRLPGDWRQTPPPPALARFGDEFVRDGQALILIVPSAIAPPESNWLINPMHPDFAKIRIQPPVAFHYDSRFFK